MQEGPTATRSDTEISAAMPPSPSPKSSSGRAEKQIDKAAKSFFSSFDEAALKIRFDQIRYQSALSVLFPIIKGIVFPMYKISLVGLAEKLFFEALQNAVPEDLFDSIEEIRNESSTPISDIYLLKGLSLPVTFAISAAFVFVTSIFYPATKALGENYFNYLEVKRLQCVIYDKFILKPNSAPIHEASELLLSKMFKIEKYYTRSKYIKYDNLSAIISSLFLFLILAWDLGLLAIVSASLIFAATKLFWFRLSTPYEEQQENKTSAANARLLDLVTCKEVILCHAKELKERDELFDMVLNADNNDISHLVRAKFYTEAFKTFTFTLVMPIMYVFVYFIDLTITRVFQLLTIVVVMDELTRCYLAYTDHGTFQEECYRAQQAFCNVLGMEYDELFPSDFDFFFGKKSNNKKSNKNLKETDVENQNNNNNNDDDDDDASSAFDSNTFKLDFRAQLQRQGNNSIRSIMISSDKKELFSTRNMDVAGGNVLGTIGEDHGMTKQLQDQFASEYMMVSDGKESEDEGYQLKNEELQERIIKALRPPARQPEDDDYSPKSKNKQNISLNNVSFGYTLRDGNLFCPVQDLSVSFQIGRRYALMGETGVGKSTVFKSINGLIAPLDGHITVGGVKIDPTSRFWREQIAVVTQNSVLLNRSLRENLCFGLNSNKNDDGTPVISDETILEALDKVNLKERVLQLPNGLDTIIEENGNEFSGGQRQRIQIARLFLSNTPIVLLDEFTSALDQATTEHILHILKPFLARKTVIMVTHDVQTLHLTQATLELKAGGIIRDITKRKSSLYRLQQNNEE